MSRNIRATAIYILNDFKRAHNKIYFDLSASIRKKFCAVDLIIKTIKLIKNFQANVFSDDDFVESFSIIVSKTDIFETDTSTSSTRAIVFKFSILKIVSVTSRKMSQVKKINQLNKSNIVSFIVNSISF